MIFDKLSFELSWLSIPILQFFLFKTQNLHIPLLYYLCILTFRWSLRLYFRKLYITGRENVPKKGPIVFAINHPTAFVDPMFLPCFFWNLTSRIILTGTMYGNKVLAWVLDSLKMIPIFRFRDGFENMRKNQEIMDDIHKQLNEGGNIVIMAEGNRVHEKRMRPIQKGTARMVFGSYGKYRQEEISVVPIGINYTDALSPRSEIMLDFGKPLLMSDYKEVYEQNDRKAIKQLTQDLGKEMKKRIIHIDNKENDEWIEGVMDVCRKEKPLSMFPLAENNREPLERELALVNKLNHLDESEQISLKAQYIDYQNIIKQNNLSINSIARPEQGGFLNLLLIILSFPIYLVGYLINALPIKIADFIRDKKVKDPEYKLSVHFSAMTLLFVFYYFIIALILAIVDIPYVGALGELGILFLFPLLGFIALQHGEIRERWVIARRFKNLSKKEQAKLQEMRKGILNFVKG